jgi:tetratricopeptide (TPR) repeat protein
MKCLEKDRTRRYETASGLAADLTRFLNNEPVVARPPSTAYRFGKFVRRHKRGVIAVGTVALALILGFSFALFAFLRERQARLATIAAEKAKQAETIRADAVGAFMGQLLTTIAPELLQQGHQRPVRELLAAADRLGATALSKAPAAELELRGRISALYLSEGPSLLDAAASHEQLKRINQLLPLVPDDKLPAPRDVFRISAAASALWAGRAEGLDELQNLRYEFRRRTPPAKDYEAWCLGIEGNWDFWKGDSAPAEAKLTEALRLMPADGHVSFIYFIRAYLAAALADRGATVETERVIREGLLRPERVTPDLASGHVGMLSVLAGALCQQKRFDEAASMLREQRGELAAHGCPLRDLLNLEKKIGEVLARAGKASEALPILMGVATNSLGTARDCVEASFVAIGSGDLESYRQLCGIGLLRFTAGAEGINALSLSEMLLATRQDDLIVQVVEELVQRAEQARDFSKESVAGTRAWLLFRKGQLAQAAALLPREFELPVPTTPIVARIRKADYLRSVVGFRTAIALAQLGRSDEARRSYAEGMKTLGARPSADNLKDLGDSYMRWYLAEAHRREAEQVFGTKGIAVPEH